MKPCIVDLPYPSLDGIECDIASAEIIYGAYSGLKGEITAILTYSYEHIMFKEVCAEIAETLMGIGLAEMKHLDILGTILKKSGALPTYRTSLYYGTYYDASFVPVSYTPEKMILDAISGELSAIRDYERMIEKLENEKIAAVLERIVLDEKLHLSVLKEIYKKTVSE